MSVVITTDSLPEGVVGYDYYVKLTVQDNNGVASDFVWSSMSNLTEFGLHLFDNGEIKGRCTKGTVLPISVTFIAQLRDDSKSVAKKTLNLFISKSVQTLCTIKITECDNDLILYAVDSEMYRCIGLIRSGFRNKVNVAIDISEGEFGGCPELNGIHNDIDFNYCVCLPHGDYHLVAIGIDYGDVWSFSMQIDDGKAIAGNGSGSSLAVVWCPPPISFSI